MKPNPITLVQLLETHGAALVILAVVIPLMALYFYKQITHTSMFERLFDAQNKNIELLLQRQEKIKDDLLVIKTRLGGDFKIQGRDDND